MTDPERARANALSRRLSPVRQQIGQLQERTVFLIARSQYGGRQQQTETPTAAELREIEAKLKTVWFEFEQAVGQLPPELMNRSILRDTQASLGRLTARVGELSRGLGEGGMQPG